MKCHLSIIGRNAYIWIYLHVEVMKRMLNSWARFPTISTTFFLNQNMFSKCIGCFSGCSTTHNMLLVIIDISSMIMTCVFLKQIMITFGSWRIDKYLHVGIWNVVDSVMVVEFKRSNATPVIANNRHIFAKQLQMLCDVFY